MEDEQNAPRSNSKLVRTSENLERIRREFIDWVDHILTRKQMTATDLAHASGLAPSTLLRIMNSKTHPFNISFMTIRKVSDGSGYPIPRTLMEAADVSNVETVPETPKPRAASPKAAAAAAASHTTAARSIPVRYVSSLPSSLVQKVRGDASEPCPPYMVGDDTAFAFRMPDDALSPVVAGGMMMFATKRRDPSQGDIVLLIDADGRAKVRLLHEINEEGMTVGKTISEAREVIPFDAIKDFGVVEGVWRRA